MKCPHCKKRIDHVFVYSGCVQRGDLEGRKVVAYDDLEILSTTDIECPECTESIKNYVKE